MLRFGPLTPSARSGNLIAGDGMKNVLSRSEQRTLSKTQNNHLTGKAPYKVCAAAGGYGEQVEGPGRPAGSARPRCARRHREKRQALLNVICRGV